MDKFICIGKNYIEHAKELGDAVPERPVLFLKPPSIGRFVNHWGERIQVKLPHSKGSVHHECEIVARLNSSGKITAITLGLDMTLRDLQSDLKKKGHPWEISKVFSGSAIVGPWISIQDFPHYLETEFTLRVDDRLQQKGKGSQMTFNPDQCIEQVSEYFPICEGDVLFTGTPAGVGPVAPNSILSLSWRNGRSYQVEFC